MLVGGGSTSPQLGSRLHVLREGGEESLVVLGQDGWRGRGLGGGGRGGQEVWWMEGERVERKLVRQSQPGQRRVGEKRVLLGGES